MSASDLDIEARLRLLAARSPTPPLPDETAELPWSVQRDDLRGGARGRLGSPRIGRPGLADSGLPLGPAGLGRMAMAMIRLAATIAVAGALLVAFGGVRGGNAGAVIGPPASIRPVVGAPGGPEVVVLPASGVVDDVMAGYIAGGIQQAQDRGAAAVIVQLDTLGGTEAAMKQIYQSLHAKIPTIVWVGPSGAKAASAGTFITLSANLAYMAPSTNIGAASPVASGGGDIAATFGQTEAQKIMQDAIGTITAIAEERHPQAVAWAVSTVQNASSYSAQQALANHGINGIAGTLQEVLAQADGQVVTVSGKQVTLHVASASTVTITENLIQMVLHTLDDPNIAFILLVIGVLALLLELFHPTLVVGLLGALSLALSFYGSGSLPLNILGVALVGLGITMLVLEPHVPSHGLLTIGGVILFVVGAIAFYGAPGPFLAPAEVAWPVIAVTAIAAAGFGLLVVQTILRNRRRRSHPGSGMVGEQGIVGKVGEVRTDLSPLGAVYLDGEEWSARARVGAVLRGDRVRVVGQEGLILIVEPMEQAAR